MEPVAITSLLSHMRCGRNGLVSKVLALPLWWLPLPSEICPVPPAPLKGVSLLRVLALWLVGSSKGLCLSHTGSLSHGKNSEGTDVMGCLRQKDLLLS